MRITFSDIDGTLLNKDREVSLSLKKEVHRITENGVPFILISSRMPAAMTHIQEDLSIAGLPLIAYNGGWVLVDGAAIHSETIPLRIVRTINEFRRGTTLAVQLFHGDEWYVESMDFYALREENNTKVRPAIRKMEETTKDWQARNISAHKVMVMGEPEELTVLSGQLERVFGRELHLYRSKDTYLEIASKRISKLTGIEMLLSHSYPELTLADCIAFGDNYNDIEMLEAVGMGVAVANARKEVLAVADQVVKSNKEDGVAEGLATFIK